VDIPSQSPAVVKSLRDKSSARYLERPCNVPRFNYGQNHRASMRSSISHRRIDDLLNSWGFGHSLTCAVDSFVWGIPLKHGIRCLQHLSSLVTSFANENIAFDQDRSNEWALGKMYCSRELICQGLSDANMWELQGGQKLWTVHYIRSDWGCYRQ
jgi:hypothetical protein